MKQKIFILSLTTLLVLTGCVRVDETFSCNASNKIAVDSKYYVATEVYDETINADGTYTFVGEDFNPEGTEVIDGKEYYFQNKSEILTKKEFEDEYYYAIITNESFYGDLTNSVFNSDDSLEDEMGAALNSALREYVDRYKLTVKFDHDVTKTNGKANGNSV